MTPVRKEQPKKKAGAPPTMDARGLSQFLDREADLDQIWSQFDADGSGTIDHGEFKELLYTCIAMFMVYQSDADMPVPTREELEPTVNNLCDELLPRLDADHDG